MSPPFLRSSRAKFRNRRLHIFSPQKFKRQEEYDDMLTKYEAEIRRARSAGDDNLLEQVENHFSSYFQYHYEQDEIEKSRHLEGIAYRLGA